MNGSGGGVRKAIQWDQGLAWFIVVEHRLYELGLSYLSPMKETIPKVPMGRCVTQLLQEAPAPFLWLILPGVSGNTRLAYVT